MKRKNLELFQHILLKFEITWKKKRSS